MRIPLTQGEFAVIDDEDYPKVMNYKWCVSKNKDGSIHYVLTRPLNELGNYKNLKLHRLIMNILDPKIKVDHINGNPLDNRKCNLRLCGTAQNSKNRKLQKNNTSGYKGLEYRSYMNKYRARIFCNGKHIYLGWFKTKEEAAEAYNIAAVKYFGEFARLNIIKGDK